MMERTICTILSMSVPAAVLLAQPGALDSTFSSDGLTTTDVGSATYDDANAILLQGDSAILVTGTAGYSGTQDFAVVRYLIDGTPDNSFGSNGRAFLSIEGGDDIAHALAVQTDGRIIIAGYTYSPGGICFSIARMNDDGTPDSSFGTNGVTTTLYPGDVTSQGRAVALQSDEKILLAGGGTAGFAIVRYNTDGSVDSTFGSDGLVTIDFSLGNDQATAMVVLPDDRILLAGYASGLVSDSIALAQLEPDGALDWTFGVGGRVLACYPTLPSFGRSLARMADGRFVIGGSAGSNAMVGRFLDDGEVDVSFNSFGFRFFTIPGTTGSNVSAVAVQPDGKVLLGGVANSASNDFLLIRVNEDGSNDAGFGSGGIVTTDFNGVLDMADCIALQADGAILLAGTTNGGIQDYDFAVARYQGGSTVGIADMTTNGGARIFPMPIEAASLISYTLDVSDVISLDIYDACSALVGRPLRSASRTAGVHTERLYIDPELPPGMYTVVLRGRTVVRSMKAVK